MILTRAELVDRAFRALELDFETGAIGLSEQIYDTYEVIRDLLEGGRREWVLEFDWQRDGRDVECLELWTSRDGLTYVLHPFPGQEPSPTTQQMEEAVRCHHTLE